ncbi:glycosyltransferase family 9 protein [Moheibacter sediminis]|uniref:ADP-heptose:LPS heptosyltransferase n=1 Tax=Moheibacter sediminis TaxID=1434700 RepID=A0A1W1ZEU8_9FLAO|nr:glycosyltransferase family 9 protein [Moheibacter sediminis]SMC46558.1 ADP-heptose:LPS heptosyltransferase [Moheibacter sediminis]
MKIPGRINSIRRRITRGLTASVGKTKTNYQNINIQKILICRPNQRLGNLLLITPLVQEVINTFPNCKIDMFVRGGLAPVIFENYENIDKIIQLPKKPFNQKFKYVSSWISLKKKSYDLVINIYSESSSGRLSTKFTKSKIKFYGDSYAETDEKPADYIHFAKHPIYNLRHDLSQIGIDTSKNTMPYLDIKLNHSEIEKGKTIIDSIVKNDKKIISIFTFATGAKCYSKEWWTEFYEKLKIAFPDYNIVEILPVENVSQINFQAHTFYSKDIREIASVIRNTSVFIGADSGMMHLASASQTPTIGLFEVTYDKKYEPYNDESISINTNNFDMDYIIKSVEKIISNE